ncbi:MAG: SDR family NAD(P)-dependent oxidoreductase, partial [Cyanobacteria bacterium P01_G01_bin.67]
MDYQQLLKDALVEMRKMRSKLESLEQEKYEAIAVIGMDCRFPGGADNPDAYWEMLKSGVDGIVEVPPSRWNIDEYFDDNPDAPGKMYTRYGGFIDDVDKFDPQFFGISPREAAAIDPQQRLLLEVTHNALENAGQSTAKLKGSKTGVYIGQCFDDYSHRTTNSGDPTRIDAFNSLGNTSSITAGRIAYVLGLQGATLQLNTTCSSSLVAVHLACQSLRNKESNLAIAGGVNLMLSPEVTIGFCRLKALSSDGHCKTFDASADGYVRGEGCGVVILKRLSDAIADNDNILAVIKGSAVNHDGASNGLTAPNGNAQETVIREALANARVKPEDVSYIEAHGTGTSLGDPIEVSALNKVFGRDRDNKLKIGSVKTNFGHLESAAGVAGLIKVILALKHQAIPPHLNYKDPNPYIPWDKVNIEVNNSLTEYDRDNLIAGVSSFGMSGTNAHVVLGKAEEQGDARAGEAGEQNLHLLTLSAKSETALQDLVRQYQQYFSSFASLKDICYTSSIGRSHYKHRLAITAQSIDDLQQKLMVGANGIRPVVNNNNKIAFLFTGQGSQYVGMGQELYETEPVFRENCDRCFQILEQYLDVSLKDIIFGEGSPKGLAPLRSASGQQSTINNQQLTINETQYTQPALFTIEYALAQLWMSWDVKPSAVMGHSIGEYVAATVAGVFNLEDALKLVAARGRLMQELPSNGSMVSILGDLELVNNLIEPYQKQVCIAAINGDKSIVISGEDRAIFLIIKQLENDDIKHKQLNVSRAFHSPLMQPMLAEFQVVAEEINYYQPQLDIVANVTGDFINSEIATADYWCQQVVSPVLFADSMRVLDGVDYQIFIECGSKPILLGMGRFCLEEEQGSKGVGQQENRGVGEKYLWVSSLKEGESDREILLNSVASLYSRGVDFDWDSFYGHGDYNKVVLPTYPFQKQSYWIDVKPVNIVSKNNVNPLLGHRLNIARSKNTVFETIISSDRLYFIQDHQVFNTAIMPAAGFIEMALSAGKEILDYEYLAIDKLTIQQPLIITELDTVVQLIINPEDSYGFEIVSLAKNDWIVHATGNIQEEAVFEDEDSNLLTELQHKCSQKIDVTNYYEELADKGLIYGSSFQAIAELWQNNNNALAKIKLPLELLPVTDNYQLHPVILDGCLQAIACTLSEAETEVYLPASLERFVFSKQITDYSQDYWGWVELKQENNNYLVDVSLLDSSGKVIAKIDNLLLRKANIQSIVNNQQNNFDNWLYEIKWQQENLLTLSSNIEVDLVALKNNVVDSIDKTEEYRNNDHLVPELENLSLAYVFQAFNNLGLQLRLGDSFTTEELISKYQIIPTQQKLFIRLLEILAAENILTKQDNTWDVVHPVGKVNLDLKLNKLRQHSEISAELNLLTNCGSQLDRILQGKTDPLDILFPQGNISALTNLYQNSPQAIFFNNLVKNTVTELINDKPQNKKLKILEIGAGTGSTTAYLLPELSGKNIEYTFSDISPLFISKAQEKFSDYDFIDYQILDIEQEQDLEEYDLIIAINVIHATENLKATTNNIRQLLKHKGLLLLAEGTQPLYWVDLIFGLTEGWWRFNDNRLSNHHPLITAEQWEALLQNNGFSQALTINDYVDSQGVILGQKNHVGAQVGAQGLRPVEEDRRKCNVWLLLGNNKIDSQSLSDILDRQERDYCFVNLGESYQQLEEDRFVVNLESSQDSARLFGELQDKYSSFEKIVYFCESEDLETDNIDRLAQKATQPILNLVQTIVKNNISIDRLVLITQGAISTHNSEQLTGLMQSTVWGMGKAIALEHPELNCTLIDLDPEMNIENQLENLVAEISSKTTEREIAFRDNQRCFPRLDKYQQPQLLNSSQPSYLTVNNPGSLDNLTLQPITKKQLGNQQVEIKIKATGLNFRDVLIALDLYPGNNKTLGCECAGEVVSVGNKVSELQVGDKVIAIAPNTFGESVIIERSLLAKFPDYLSFTDAATIPVTFLTAYYTLCHLGKISAGKRVLIHAAAGGVGQAAIQLAQQAGAEIFATASLGKWDYLKSLGVKHIMNSRSLDFAEEVNNITNGEGVDIILNSLSGDFIPASLSVLKEDGCFLEIGKLDIWDETQVHQQLPNAEYHIIDMVQLCQQQPDLIQSMLSELMAKFDSRELQPLPKKVFPLAQAKSAFRYLQQAKHIGKIVITPELTLDENGSYLITGGLGGLGILTAQWLAEKGARNLILLGRSQPSTYAQVEIAKLQQQGINIDVIQTDITNYNSLKQIFASRNLITSSSSPAPSAPFAPLRGVIHAAGMLDDSAIQNMTWSQMERVLQPKVTGAWNLHNLTKDISL